MTVPVIAIDGPAASGKSSTAALVARRLGWAHLDSGALYRAVTLAALEVEERRRDGGSSEGHESGRLSPARIIALAESLPVRLILKDRTYCPEVAGVDVSEAIRDDRVTARVSEVAAMREVRAWVNERQRAAVGGHRVGGVVVDGRDIGTVVFPEAPLKVFLTAAAEERARRRLRQRGEADNAERMEQETRRLTARDHADSSRPVAPLAAATDAVLLDTTALSLDEQVEQMVALAHERFPR
jgi:cytidylate kinase